MVDKKKEGIELESKKKWDDITWKRIRAALATWKNEIVIQWTPYILMNKCSTADEVKLVTESLNEILTSFEYMDWDVKILIKTKLGRLKKHLDTIQ